MLQHHIICTFDLQAGATLRSHLAGRYLEVQGLCHRAQQASMSRRRGARPIPFRVFVGAPALMDEQGSCCGWFGWSSVLERFERHAPAGVMACLALEHALPAGWVDEVFEARRQRQYPGAELPLGTDAAEVADQQHAYHQLQIDRGASDQAVVRRHDASDERRVQQCVHRAEQVVAGRWSSIRTMENTGSAMTRLPIITASIAPWRPMDHSRPPGPNGGCSAFFNSIRCFLSLGDANRHSGPHY